MRIWTALLLGQVAAAPAAAMQTRESVRAPQDRAAWQQRFIDEVEGQFRDLDTALRNGDCNQHHDLLLLIGDNIAASRPGSRRLLYRDSRYGGVVIPPQTHDDWQRRLDAARQVPCPQPGMTRTRPAGTPATSSVPAAQVAPAPQTPPSPSPQPPGDPESPEDILDDASPTQDLLSGSGSLDRERVRREADDARAEPGTGDVAPSQAQPNSGQSLELSSPRLRELVSRFRALLRGRLIDTDNCPARQARIVELEAIVAEFERLTVTAVDRDRARALRMNVEDERRLVESCLKPRQPSRPTRGLRDTDRVLLLEAFGEGWSFFTDLSEDDLPSLGVGVRRDGAPGQAPEVDAGRTAEGVTTIGGGVEHRLLIGGAMVRLHGAFAEGSARTSFSVPASSGSGSSSPAGRIDSGIVYGGLSPGGSSGIIAPFGLNGATKVDLSRFRIGGEADLLAAPRTRLFISLDYFHETRDARLSAAGSGSVGSGSSTSSFQFSQSREQELTRNLVSVGVGGEIVVPLQRGHGGVRLVGGGSAGATLLFERMESFERNTNNFSSGSDRDFTLSFEESREAVEFWARTRARVEIDLSPLVALYVGAAARYDTGTGYVFNPFSGDQVFFDGLTTTLRSRSTWSWSASGGIVVRFGSRQR